MRVSVCMASYNGSRHIEEQIRSILTELSGDDELLIVDDASRDRTTEIIRSIDDPRIRLIERRENSGYVRTFEHAIAQATGDVIILADQDDVWIPGRRALLVGSLADAQVAASNLVVLGSDAPLRSPVTGHPWRLSSRTSRQRRRNITRILMGVAPYYGSAMAVRSDYRSTLLPFPPYLTESHDLWIAIAANVGRSMTHVEAATVRRRFHDANSSSPRPRGPIAVIRARVMLVRLVMEARRRQP